MFAIEFEPPLDKGTTWSRVAVDRHPRGSGMASQIRLQEGQLSYRLSTASHSAWV